MLRFCGDGHWLPNLEFKVFKQIIYKGGHLFNAFICHRHLKKIMLCSSIVCGGSIYVYGSFKQVIYGLYGVSSCWQDTAQSAMVQEISDDEGDCLEMWHPQMDVQTLIKRLEQLQIQMILGRSFIVSTCFNNLCL